MPEATLERAIGGDEAAIATVWRLWNPRLLRFLRSRRVAEPDDLAQTIWLEIARNLGEFNGGHDEFRRWFFTVAHRRVIDNGRRIQRRPVTTPLFNHDSPATEQGHASLDWAIGLLSRLPDKQATAVALRILADMDVIDVAAVMGKSPGAVRVLTHRGLQRLGEITDSEGNLRAGVTESDSLALTLTS